MCAEKYEGFEKCMRFQSDTGFRLIPLVKGDHIAANNIEFCNLVFVLEGEVEFSSSDFLRQRFKQDEFFFLPHATDIYGIAVVDSRVLLLSFGNRVELPCDNCTLYSYVKSYNYVKEEKEIPNLFRPLQVTSQIKLFEEQMVSYLLVAKKMPCDYLYDLKQKELFIILTYNYTRKELAEFFYPVLGYGTSFKQRFQAIYKNGLSISEIASKMNMSLRTFSRKFYVEFGEPARYWLLKQKAKNIKLKLSIPGTTISDIILEFDFTDMSHFTKFCKHFYDCTPAELMRQIKEDTSNR